MKLVAIDALNLIHRAYHAIPHLSTSQGIPTNAVMGMVNVLLKLLEEEKPDYFVCVFDYPGPTFRHEAYGEYKAGRPPTPPDLSSQIAIARELMEAFGIPTLEMEGLEADDVLAALATRASKEGIDSLLVSNDRDLLQVVDEKIHVLSSRRRLEETILYTPEEVESRLGVAPGRVTDLKALMGDATDNIPGVPGIGQKTAASLLKNLGSLDELYGHLEEVEPPRLREALAERKEAVFRSRELVRLRSEADLPFSLEECRAAGINWSLGLEVLRKYELQRAAERIISREELGTLPRVSGEHARLSQPSEVDSLRGRASQARAFGLSALQLGQEIILAFHACTSESETPGKGEDGEGTAVVALPVVWGGPSRAEGAESGLFQTVSSPAVERDLAAAVQRLLEAAEECLTVHDGKETVRTLLFAGLSLPPPSFDTFLASYLLEPGRQAYPLAELCRRLLGHDLIPLPAERGGDGADLPDGALASLAGMARCVAHVTPILRQQIVERGLLALLRHLEIPLALVLAEMELAGVKLDVRALRQLSDQLESKISDLEKEICALAGHPFNVASTKQLQQVLYSELGLKGTKRTKTGFSTDVEALERIAGGHPIIPLVLEHRTYSKLKSTYVDALTQAADPLTGRVHTTFNQAGTATGRLSSSDPNLQNIPIRTDWGTEIRRCFIAEEGNLLLAADYSQIELRILAHLSQEPVLLKVFSSGGDVHTETACTIFNVPEESVTPDMRRQAKTVNFGIIYGMGGKALALELGIPEDQAQALINDYFRKLPRVRDYLETTKEDVRKIGFAVTILGRKRPFPDISSPDRQVRAYAERAAVNAPLQGSAADVIKLAMLNIRKDVLPKFPGAKMILQVHDELLFELPAGQLRVLAREVQVAMETAYQLCIPLGVDLKVGKNWGEMENYA